MKNTNENMSIASLVILSLGIGMKIYHAPASNIVLILGTAGVLFILLPKIIENVTSKATTKLNSIAIYTTATLMLIGIGAKLFHVPAANLVLIIGLLGINLLFVKTLRILRS